MLNGAVSNSKNFSRGLVGNYQFRLQLVTFRGRWSSSDFNISLDIFNWVCMLKLFFYIL
jgi:hypothetical protein